MTVLIRFDNLTLGYDRHPAVHHLSGMIAQRDMLAVIGPNGGGKSTLIRGLAGEMKPIGGHIVLEGLAREQMAVLPQRLMLNDDFPISVLEVVTSGLWRTIGAWDQLDEEHDEKIGKALARVGLTGFEHRTVDTLSRGQLQRVLFARLLLQDARVVLLDEPFTAIDPATTETLLRLLHDLNDSGLTIVAVLQDLGQVRSHFASTLLLARHAVAWGTTRDVLGEDNLEAAEQLSAAWDEDAARCLWDDAT